jgi:hypothetical protein
MKKLSLALLTLSLFTVAFAPQALGQAGWKGWQNVSHNLEWKMPADWKITVNKGTHFQACEPGNQFCIDIWFTKGKMNVATLAMNQFGATTGHAAKSITFQRALSAIQGFNGHVIQYTGQKSGKKVWSVIVGLACQFNDSNAVVQLSWFDHPRYNTVNQQFAEQVARTLKLKASR